MTIPVLLAVYGGDSLDYLKEAVDSILSQTYKDVLLYIGVDGPVEKDTDDYLKCFETNKRVEIRRFSENNGLAFVLNHLLEKCKDRGYEYYARMDADDVALPDRLERQVAFLEQHPEIDVVGGAIEEIDENGALRGKTVHYPLTNEACRAFFRYRDPVAHPSVVFRARFFEKVKSGYREAYRRNQDTMLWFDGIKNGCVFANLPDTVLQYRVREVFYKERLGNWTLAVQKLKARMKINRELNYDLSAYLFAFALLGMTMLPAWVKKILYKRR